MRLGDAKVRRGRSQSLWPKEMFIHDGRIAVNGVTGAAHGRVESCFSKPGRAVAGERQSAHIGVTGCAKRLRRLIRPRAKH